MQEVMRDYLTVWKQFVLRGVMQEDLYQFAEGSECVVVFADADVCIVDIVGKQPILEKLEHLGLATGSLWSEERQGSNALALALQESFPIQLDGAMHYLALFHRLYTSAAPVHDLLGQAVGVLAVIGYHEHCHPHTRARLTFANVVGESPALQEAVRLGRMASSSNSTVLLHGETGTGKEIFAQSIHNNSGRSNGPFIAINCAAIPRELINTELFGYEGGAFTGADRQGRPGKFEQAHGGTLFLDEIGDMPRDLQTSLLRAIETRTVVRVGGQRVILADVRIIAATHKDLREESQLGNFRNSS